MTEKRQPSIAKMEQEQEAYYQHMKSYYERMRSLPKKEATAVAKQDLEEAGIINETGELTDRYSYSREYGRNREGGD